MSWIDDIMANAPPGAFPWLDDLRDSAMRSGVMQGGPAPEAPAQARPLTEADIGDLGGEGFSRRAGEGIIGEAGARRTGLRQAIRGGIGRDVRSVNAVDVEGVRWFRDPRTGEAVPFSRVIIQPPYPGSPALTAEQARNLDTGGAVRGGIAGRVPTGMFPMSGSTIRSVSPLEGKSPEEVARLKAKAEEMLRAQEGAEAQALPREDFLTIKALAARGAGPDALAAAMAGLREKRQNEVKPFALEAMKEEAATARQQAGIAATESAADRREAAAQAREERRAREKYGEDQINKWEDRLFSQSQSIQAAVDSAAERGLTKQQAEDMLVRRQKAMWDAIPQDLRAVLKARLGVPAIDMTAVKPGEEPLRPAVTLQSFAGLKPERITEVATKLGREGLMSLEESDLIKDLIEAERGGFTLPIFKWAKLGKLGGRGLTGLVAGIGNAIRSNPDVRRALEPETVQAGLLDLLAQALPAAGK